MTWTREQMIAALPDGHAADRCREALLAGAPFHAPPGESVPASQLREIYERRERHLAQRAIRTIGLDDTVALLRELKGELRLAAVHTDEWNFMLFAEPDRPQIVSCFAVDASVANPDLYYSELQH